MNREVSIIVAVCVMCVCCVAALSRQGVSTGEVAADRRVVALVNGEAIPYSAIKVTVEAAKNRFALEHERAPAAEEDYREVERLRQRYELKQLASRILATIRSQQLARFGIECSDAELRTQWERMLEERDPPATRASRRAKITNLLECLRAVHEDSVDPDVVYDTRLTYTMTRKEWKSVLRQYRAPDMRRLLAEHLIDEEAFDEGAKDAARSVLIMQRTMQAVEEDLVRTDPEFAEYLRLVKTDPRNEKVRSKAPNYRAAKRQEWWRRRYREADIQIKDERFKDVLKELFR